MKRITIILWLLLCLTSWAQATTRTAATCNSSDVQATINASANGDTVQLPLGSSCTWSSSSTGGLTYTGVVNISNVHQVTLDGNGSTITFAGNGTDPGFAKTSLSVVTGLSNAAGTGTVSNTVIKNFTFIGGFTNGRFPIVIISAPGNLPYRVTNCTFNNVNGTVFGLFGAGGTQGLLDHNSFTTTSNTIEVIHNFGSIDNNDNAGNQTNDWSSDVVPGGPNFIFVETNTFTGPAINPASSEAVENFSGASIVFRHNTLTNVDFDAHGGFLGNPSNCTMVGTRWYEVYQNTWNLTVASDSPTINMRQGSGVVWSNTHPATGKIQLQADCLSASSGVPYPFQDQDGRGITTSSGSSTTHASPIYIWNDPNFNIGTTSQDGSATTYIQLNRDYFVSASQPSSLFRCESAADVAAGCPFAYVYTPFTYPHPLTGGTPTPAVSLSRSSIAFGNQNVSTSSGNVNTVVTNTGTANLTVSSVAVTGADLTQYSINTNTCTVTIAPSGTCNFNTVFSPTSTGVKNAFSTVTSNAPTSPNNVTLSGTGINPITVTITVLPNSLAFGNQIIGQVSTPVTVTVTSTGTGNEVLGTPFANFTAGGTNPVPADFALVGSGGSPCSNGLSLAPSTSCTFTATITATQATLETATLNVNGTVSATIQASGTGIPASPVPSPAPQIFSMLFGIGTIDLVVGNCPKTCKIHLVCTNCTANYTGTIQ